MRMIFLFLVVTGLFQLIVTAPSVSAQPQPGNLVSALEDFGRMPAEQKDMILGSMGIPGASGFSMAKIVAWIVFGGVGFVAFAYGKKQQSLKPLLTGLVLMGYPYFVNDTFWLYAVGAGLCFLLYFWRD